MDKINLFARCCEFSKIYTPYIVFSHLSLYLSFCPNFNSFMNFVHISYTFFSVFSLLQTFFLV